MKLIKLTTSLILNIFLIIFNFILTYLINDKFIKIIHTITLIIIVYLLSNMLFLFNYIKHYVINQKISYINTIYYDSKHATPNQFDEVLTYCYVGDFYNKLPKQCDSIKDYAQKHNKNKDIYKD